MKMKNKRFLFALVLALVFSLTLGTVASALNVRGTGSYGIPEDEQIERGIKWEELNSLVCEINERFLGENITGNYFTNNYTNALRNARDYAQYLLDTPASTYGELSDMTDSLQYLISESGNPANHELADHYTVAFTDTQGWGDTVYVYAWNTKGFYEFEWPGIGVRSSYTNEFGQKQFYAYIGEEYDYVIFSSSSGAQTADIPLYDKTGYYPTGEVDAKGNYKVNNWHISNPNYPEYTVPTDPTEPTQVSVPTESNPTTSTEPYGDIPHFSPDNPSEDYIDYYLPKYDTTVKLTLHNYNSELYNELYDLIITTDSTIGAPGNNYPDNYKERVMRVRNFSASVYNHDRMEDHELTGAIRALQMAFDGESYGRIIDCLRYYFIYADYVPTVSTEPTDATQPTQATEATKPTEPESNYKPGEVLVMLNSGSASTISDALKDFEIEEIYLLTPGGDQKCFKVTFKEKSKEIVWRAIAALSTSPNVKAAEPNYIGVYDVLDDEASYNQMKNDLKEEAYSIPEAGEDDTDYQLQLNRLILDVRHSIYDLNGREFVAEHWIDKIGLLGSMENAIRVFKNSSSAETDYQRVYDLLNQAYFALIPPEPQYKRGDADGDGSISVLDATKIQKVLASLEKDTDGMISYRGDVTGDGLDILDATAIQKYLAGIELPYHINELFS